MSMRCPACQDKTSMIRFDNRTRVDRVGGVRVTTRHLTGQECRRCGHVVYDPASADLLDDDVGDAVARARWDE